MFFELNSLFSASSTATRVLLPRASLPVCARAPVRPCAREPVCPRAPVRPCVSLCARECVPVERGPVPVPAVPVPVCPCARARACLLGQCVRAPVCGEPDHVAM